MKPINADPPPKKAPDHCPHCGIALSSWEQVLLSVDRTLMCRHCWYRIIADEFDPDNPTDSQEREKP